MVDESSRRAAAGGELAPGPLGGVVDEYVSAAVKLPLVAASENDHLGPQHRRGRVPRHLREAVKFMEAKHEPPSVMITSVTINSVLGRKPLPTRPFGKK